MIDLQSKVKYQLRYTRDFKKNYKKIKKQATFEIKKNKLKLDLNSNKWYY